MFRDFFKTSQIIDFIIREDTKANGHCRITSSPDLEDLKSVVLQMGYPIGSPYAAIFDGLRSLSFKMSIKLKLSFKK